LNFEDTYDGLGDALDETDDAFNDDTFGGEPATQRGVGRDFDFAGQTSKIANTLAEEQMLYAARQPPAPRPASPSQASRPKKTGYESYAQPDYLPRLEADASIWGTAPKRAPQDVYAQQRQQAPAPVPAAGRRMMSLEEVEAQLRAQAKSSTPTQQAFQLPPQQQQQQSQYNMHPQQQQQYNMPLQAQQQYQQTPPPAGFQPQILQRHQQHQMDQRLPPSLQQAIQAELPTYEPQHPPQILQRQQRPTPPVEQQQQPRQPSMPTGPVMQQARASPQPRQILQNPNRLSGHGQPMAPPPQQQQQQIPRMPPTGPMHQRDPSNPGQVITDPSQILHGSEEERANYVAEQAKRAKRNHKIFLLSKDNGLMTPQDKNFITRIQLQSLVTATGGVEEQGAEASLVEDFYYQVYSQIRGAPRQNPNQPANQFAQTYLFQTGGRYGMGRRQHRGGDNHMQRMEQQVQRAVEAAKAKPKNKQLVIEGSLGKISFSNAKTPKPLLNIKRNEDALRGHGQRPSRGQHDASIIDRKIALRDMENVYNDLMLLEDHERRIPPRLTEESSPDMIQSHMEWQQALQGLNRKLWADLKVMEPIIPKYVSHATYTSTSCTTIDTAIALRHPTPS